MTTIPEAAVEAMDEWRRKYTGWGCSGRVCRACKTNVRNALEAAFPSLAPSFLSGSRRKGKTRSGGHR